MPADREPQFGIVAVPLRRPVGHKFVKKTWQQLVEDLRPPREQSVYQPALWNPAPGRRISWQDVALHHRHGPVAFCEDPGGQQSAHACAEDYRSFT
jgi:hypothetical protein